MKSDRGSSDFSQDRKTSTAATAYDSFISDEVQKKNSEPHDRGLLSWLGNNKEWVFSGIGVTILTLSISNLPNILTTNSVDRDSSYSLEEPSSSRAVSTSRFSHASFIFELQRCDLTETDNGFKCYVKVTNTTPEERRLTIYSSSDGNISQAFESAKGNVFDAKFVVLGNSSARSSVSPEDGATFNIPSNVPVVGRLDFYNPSLRTEHLSLLQFIAKDENGEVFKVQFENIKLTVR